MKTPVPGTSPSAQTPRGFPYGAVLTRCHMLNAGQEVTFTADSVPNCFGFPELAEIRVLDDLGDPAGQRFRIEFTSDRMLTVSLQPANAGVAAAGQMEAS